MADQEKANQTEALGSRAERGVRRNRKAKPSCLSCRHFEFHGKTPFCNVDGAPIMCDPGVDTCMYDFEPKDNA